MKSVDPKWLEQFDMHVFDEREQMLEIMIFDKRTSTFMGRLVQCLSLYHKSLTTLLQMLDRPNRL